jgi:hypothetical protein
MMAESPLINASRLKAEFLEWVDVEAIAMATGLVAETMGLSAAS